MNERKKEGRWGKVGLVLPITDVFGLQKLGLPAEAGVAVFVLQKLGLLCLSCRSWGCLQKLGVPAEAGGACRSWSLSVCLAEAGGACRSWGCPLLFFFFVSAAASGCFMHLGKAQVRSANVTKAATAVTATEWETSCSPLGGEPLPPGCKLLKLKQGYKR